MGDISALEINYVAKLFVKRNKLLFIEKVKTVEPVNKLTRPLKISQSILETKLCRNLKVRKSIISFYYGVLRAAATS